MTTVRHGWRRSGGLAAYAAVALCAACATDDEVTIVIERGLICDPGAPPESCRLVELPGDAGRELSIYRASSATACDAALARRAISGDASDPDRVHAQSFRGGRGAPVGELDDGRYAFVALVREAVDGCPVAWWGCTVAAVGDGDREVEIALETLPDGVGGAGCGVARTCVIAEGRCE